MLNITNCLLAICISSLEKCLFGSSAQFWIRWFVCLIFSCMSYLYILEINPWSVASLANIFSHSEVCLFILFMVSFAVQKHLSIIRSHLFIFVFISISLGGGSKRILRGFRGGAVVENLPANTGNTGSSPGLGRSHMPWSNWALEPQLLSLSVWSLCSAPRDASIVTGPCTTIKSGPRLPQLGKALAQEQRPNAAINK